MKNRWVNLIAGILMQTVLGGIYAWSTFTPYLVDNYGLRTAQSGFIFGLNIAVFTIVMIASGRIFTKKGPRFTATIGAILFMCGYVAASFSSGIYPMLLVSLSIVMGAGIGFGYVCPLSVGIKWFPDKKGLVTGAAVAGFGGGAVLLSSIAQHFLTTGMDVLVFFRYYGLVSGGILLLSASFMANPPSSGNGQVQQQKDASIWNLAFAIITLGMFAGTFAGLLIIGNLTPLLLKSGLTATQAVTSISIFAVGNAVGRITWGHISDHLSYKCIPLSLCCFSFFCVFLLLPLPIWAIMLTVGFLGFGFGANFVIYASTISSIFSIEAFPKLYPICFLGYGIAGIIGPGLGGYLADATGSYNTALYISIAMLTAVGIISGLCSKTFRAGRNNT
ncbi:MAG: MFS transporter [Sedimentisphaeraceae bacterium JB056]